MTIGAVGRDPATADFLDGTAVGEFRLRRSRATGEYLAPQCLTDSTGSSDLETVVACGRGAIVSWTVVHGKPHDGVAPPVDVLAIVQLDEGPWWWGTVLDADLDQVREGSRVVLDFVRAEGSQEWVPAFRVLS